MPKSIAHSVSGRVLGAGAGSAVGNVEFAAAAAIIFGMDIRMTSTLRK